MRIAVVTSNYPWPSRPYCGTFVRELVWELARQGHDCSVVAPVSIWERPRFGPLGRRTESESVPRSSAVVRVFRPRIVTASARRIGPWNTTELSEWMFGSAVSIELDKIAGGYDVIYAHFFYPAGRAAIRYARRSRQPCFVAHGDDAIHPWHLNKGNPRFRDLTGVVAVSTDNARFCRTVFDIPDSKVEVFPNGVDRALFFPRDRAEARRRLNLPEGLPLVAFVGHFIPRKGPDRVLSALEGLPSVKALMIGEGPMVLRSECIAFQGVVEHDQLPWYLSAANVFVLPTTGEGSCNAVLEAMACGLPVVTANASFHDNILNSDVAIRIDPLNISEIRQAMDALLADPMRREFMGERCAEWSARFSIEKRAARIAAWMADLMGNGMPGGQT